MELPHPGVPGDEIARGLLLFEATYWENEAFPVLVSGTWVLGEDASDAWDIEEAVEALSLMIPEALRQAREWRHPPADLVVIVVPETPEDRPEVDTQQFVDLIQSELRGIGFSPLVARPSLWCTRLRGTGNDRLSAE
jgi:hypothetical protein